MEFRRRSLTRYDEYDIEKQEWIEPQEEVKLFSILCHEMVNLIRTMMCCSNRLRHDHGSKAHHDPMPTV